MKISKHISYREATRSFTAKKLGIPNTPNEEQLENMEYIGESIFEPLRAWVGGPIKIESFFRHPKVNARTTGASKNSQHQALRKEAAIDKDDDYMRNKAMQKLAHNPNYHKIRNSDMFCFIIQYLNFDQIIWEFGDGDNPGWIHTSYNRNGNRNRITIAYRKSGKAIYEHFENFTDFIKRKKEIYKIEN